MLGINLTVRRGTTRSLASFFVVETTDLRTCACWVKSETKVMHVSLNLR